MVVACFLVAALNFFGAYVNAKDGDKVGYFLSGLNLAAGTSLVILGLTS